MTKYSCPMCQSDDLQVVVKVWAALTQEEKCLTTKISVVDSHSTRHRWDDESQMQCMDCGTQEKAEKFKAAEVMLVTCFGGSARYITARSCYALNQQYYEIGGDDPSFTIPSGGRIEFSSALEDVCA